MACATRYVGWWKEEDECGKKEQQVAGGEFPSWQHCRSSQQVSVSAGEQEMDVGFGMAGVVREGIGQRATSPSPDDLRWIGCRGWSMVGQLLWYSYVVGGWWWEGMVAQNPEI